MKPSPYDKYFVSTYKRSGSAMVRGRGAYLFDAAGKKYLDFGSGIAVTALGHSYPALVSELKKQGSRLIHASNLYYTEPQTNLAKLLVSKTFGDCVFLCNSGTEAAEAAIKFTRKWATSIDKKKYGILSFTDGFHGRTYGALSATAQYKFHAGFHPLVQGFYYAPFNDIAKTKNILDSHRFAAIFVEPLQGEGGVNAASAGFMRFLRKYATSHKIALVFDEIQCGMGRTGTLWYYQQLKIVPDLMLIAKPIGGGLPLGAVVCKRPFVKQIAPGDHGTTFGGNPLACALGNVVLSTISKPAFLAGVRAKGAYLKMRLEGLAKRFPLITEVRGEGLLLGVRTKSDPLPLVAAARTRGLLLIKAENNTVRFMPRLNVTRQEIDKAIAIFEKVLRTAA